MSSWQNINTNKKVFTIAKPLDEEQALLDSIPKNAIITAYTKSTKTVRITYVLNKEDILKEVAETIKTNTKPITLKRVPLKENDDGLLAIVNIADFHLNRYVDGAQTNGEDYNLEIAKSVFLIIVDKMTQSMRYKSISKIILNLSGDFLNSDTVNGTTTAGTPQDDDVFWQEAFTTATGLLEYACKEFSKIAPVEFLYIRGNHDTQAGFYLTAWLDARFRNFEAVDVKLTPKPRQTIIHGTNIIILTHGNTEGARVINLPYIENETKDKLGKATNIEVITGHYHSTQAFNDNNGVRLFRLSSSCPISDNYTYNKAYTPLTEASVLYYDNEYRVGKDYINTKQIYNKIIS